jgi:hypothetical protein
MRSDPVRPERHAAATTYQAGPIKSQLKIHKALLLHAEIINTVTANARKDAERSEMGVLRNPRRTPRIAGRRKRNTHNVESDIQRDK